MEVPEQEVKMVETAETDPAKWHRNMDVMKGDGPAGMRGLGQQDGPRDLSGEIKASYGGSRCHGSAISSSY